MKVIAIAFSDLHLGDFPKFNTNNKRTLSHFKVLFKIRKLCLKYNCPALCAGDLFHKPEVMNNEFLDITIEQFNKLSKKKWDLYCISGNHDMSMRNLLDKPSPSWVRTLSSIYSFIHCMDNTTLDLGGFALTGIPYLDNNQGLNTAINDKAKDVNKPHILLLHTDYPGAKDTDGTEVGQVENFNINLLKPYKLVLIGHIHKPQRLSKKVYMIGAPLQQRRTDRNCALGYYKIFEDYSVKFVEFKKFPKFIDVSEDSEIKEDGNYYTLIPKPAEETIKTSHGVTKGISKSKLVKNYMKAIGMKDHEKKRVLINLINEVE